MFFKWRRDIVRWSEWVPGEPTKIVMFGGDISVDWQTNLLLPGLVEAFGPGDRITLVTATFTFRKEPLLALNASTGELIRAERWVLWAAILLPALLFLPILRNLGPAVVFGALLAAMALAALLDLAVARAAAKLLASCEQEAAHPRTALAELAPRIGITILDEPEPDWNQILLDRWNGDLDGGDRHDLGSLALPEGRVLAGEPGSLDRADVVAVPPGQHRVWLVVARMENDARVSHAFLAVGKGKASKVVPVLSAEGAAIEIGVDGGMAAFASPGAAASLAVVAGAAEQDYPIVKAMQEDRGDWIRFAVPGSDDVVAAFHSGYGDGMYPLVTLQNDRGEVLAVAIDFLVW